MSTRTINDLAAAREKVRANDAQAMAAHRRYMSACEAFDVDAMRAHIAEYKRLDALRGVYGAEMRSIAAELGVSL